MSKYYVDSFAYDYDMFMPQPAKKNNVVEINRKKSYTNRRDVKKRTKNHVKLSSIRTAATVMLVALVLGLVVGNIYLRVRVNEVTTDINAAQTQYNRLKSENVSLNMQLETNISYKNLEQSAKDLGMQKAEPYQINYVSTNSENKTEIKSGDDLVTAQKDK